MHAVVARTYRRTCISLPRRQMTIVAQRMMVCLALFVSLLVCCFVRRSMHVVAASCAAAACVAVVVAAQLSVPFGYEQPHRDSEKWRRRSPRSESERDDAADESGESVERREK